MIDKLKITMRSSELSASCRMVFFKIPYSKKISQIRAFRHDVVDGEKQLFWSTYIFYRDGEVLASKSVYSSLSYAMSNCT